MIHPATQHFSIIDVTITDDFIDRRSKAATAVATRWRKMPSAQAALDKASMLADAIIETANGGPVPTALRNEVGPEIQKVSPTHDPNDRGKDFEVAVVASVAAIMLFETTAIRTPHCSLFAEALSAAMDISATTGAPRVAQLWEDLSRAARMLGDGRAEALRVREAVDIEDTAAAIRTLSENATKDQEEINLLWWTLADWSALAKARLSSLPNNDAVVSAAIELTSLLSWPAVRALRQLAHRNVPAQEQNLTLQALSEATAAIRAAGKAALADMDAIVMAHPRVFVALTAVTADDAVTALTEAGLNPQRAEPAWKWTERLVREISLCKSTGAQLGLIG